MDHPVHAFPAGHDRRVFLHVVGEKQGCPCFQMKLHIAVKLDCTCQVDAGRDIDHPAPRFAAGSDCIGNRFGTAYRTAVYGSVFGDVKGILSIKSFLFGEIFVKNNVVQCKFDIGGMGFTVFPYPKYSSRQIPLS